MKVNFFRVPDALSSLFFKKKKSGKKENSLGAIVPLVFIVCLNFCSLSSFFGFGFSRFQNDQFRVLSLQTAFCFWARIFSLFSLRISFLGDQRSATSLLQREGCRTMRVQRKCKMQARKLLHTWAHVSGTQHVIHEQEGFARGERSLSYSQIIILKMFRCSQTLIKRAAHKKKTSCTEIKQGCPSEETGNGRGGGQGPVRAEPPAQRAGPPPCLRSAAAPGPPPQPRTAARP